MLSRSTLNSPVLRRFFLSKRARKIIAILVIILTVSFFTIYVYNRPETISILLSLGVIPLIALTLLYLITIAANALVLSASLRLIGTPVSYLENLLLTSYSSIVNFFGPLQSGPGFRALYLKQRHGVSVRSFTFYTIFFYAVFAILNGATIGIAAIIGLQTGYPLLLATGMMIILICLIATVRHYSAKFRTITSRLDIANRCTWMIVLGAALLSLATAGAYYVELTHVDASISFIQALVYAAAANLALFVSLTPGAIGFRESFLLLSQRLHGIPSDVVVTASIIDRAYYVCFLAVLFVVVVLVGARTKLFRRNLRERDA